MPDSTPTPPITAPSSPAPAPSPAPSPLSESQAAAVVNASTPPAPPSPILVALEQLADRTLSNPDSMRRVLATAGVLLLPVLTGLLAKIGIVFTDAQVNLGEVALGGYIAQSWAHSMWRAKLMKDLAIGAMPANDNAAAQLLNKIAAIFLAVVVGSVMLGARPAYAQDEACSDALDAGTPAPWVKEPRGYVLPDDSWVGSSGRMCLTGQACGQSSGVSLGTAVGLTAGGALVGAAVAVVVMVVVNGAKPPPPPKP